VVAITLVGVAPIVVAADYARRTDSAVEQVFGNGKPVTANPGTLATTTTSSTVPDTTTVASSSTSSSSSTSTTVAPFPGLDRVNVLLLGGDAGPGRYSLRTDSMIVVSIDPDTGDTAMISVPRNLEDLPFPPGTAMADEFAEFSDGEGVDLVVDAAGSAGTKRMSLAALRPGGATVWIGLHGNTMEFDSYGVTLPEKQIFGTYAAKIEELGEALQLMQSGKVDVTSWTETVPLEQSVSAFHRMLAPSDRDLKAVFIP
jgi:hypothetical protein